MQADKFVFDEQAAEVAAEAGDAVVTAASMGQLIDAGEALRRQMAKDEAKHYDAPVKVEERKTIVNIDHIGRNKKCPCGSGKKFKVCCKGKEPRKTQEIVHKRLVIQDRNVARQLAAAKKAGKTVRMQTPDGKTITV